VSSNDKIGTGSEPIFPSLKASVAKIRRADTASVRVTSLVHAVFSSAYSRAAKTDAPTTN
jgi:hypothetical protein